MSSRDPRPDPPDVEAASLRARLELLVELLDGSIEDLPLLDDDEAATLRRAATIAEECLGR